MDMPAIVRRLTTGKGLTRKSLMATPEDWHNASPVQVGRTPTMWTRATGKSTYTDMHKKKGAKISTEQDQFRRETLILCCTLRAMLDCSMSTQGTALMRLLLFDSCASHGISEEQCNPDGSPDFLLAEAGMTRVLAIEALQAAMAGLLTMALSGQLADAYGRWVPVCLSLIAHMLAATCWASFSSFGPTASLFYGGLLFAALIGNFDFMKHGLRSMIADVTLGEPAALRSRYFGWVESCGNAGGLAGPFLASLVSGYFGNRAAILFSAGISAAALVVVWFFFQETLEPPRRQEFQLKRANVFSAISIFGRSRYTIILALTIAFSIGSNFIILAPINTYVLRLSHANADVSNVYATFTMFNGMLGLAVALPFLLNYFNTGQYIVFSMLINVGWGIGLSMSTRVWQIFALHPISAIAGPFSVVMMSFTSTVFGEKMFGEAMAAGQTISYVAGGLSAAFAEDFYGKTSHITYTTSSGFGVHCVVFLVGAAASAFVAVLASFLINVPKEELSNDGEMGDALAKKGINSKGLSSVGGEDSMNSETFANSASFADFVECDSKRSDRRVAKEATRTTQHTIEDDLVAAQLSVATTVDDEPVAPIPSITVTPSMPARSPSPRPRVSFVGQAANHS